MRDAGRSILYFPPENGSCCVERMHPCPAEGRRLARRSKGGQDSGVSLNACLLGMLVIVLMTSWGRSAVAADKVPTDSIFAPTSFWYAPIPRDAPLNAKSAQYVQEFIRQKKKFFGTVSINMAAYASPVYTVDADVPTVRVTQWTCLKAFPKPNPGLVPQWEAVPIPSYAEPANGRDAEMTIYQPETDTIWEFWKARKTDEGRWEACHGGRMENASKKDGRWHSFYGTTATGLPFLGGQITAEELQRGEIRHAIGITLVEAEDAKVLSWPAMRSDGRNPERHPDRIPEGLRFRLDPNVNVDALPLKRAGKIIARAAQKYGFVVWDKGGAITLRAQNPKSYTATGGENPYPELLEGPAWAVLKNFPWDKLQFLPPDYGKQ